MTRRFLCLPKTLLDALMKILVRIARQEDRPRGTPRKVMSAKLLGTIN